MKKITLGAAIALSAFAVNAQESVVEDIYGYEQYYNWHRQDVSKTVMGTNVEQAYELLKGKKPAKTVVVAVIDCGVEISHDDLRGNIWFNEDEIPDNGIDDDNNGYIDDINGWNYLGNAEGENIEKANLEVTRIYRDLKAKYDESDENQVTDKEEFAQYVKVKSKVQEKRDFYDDKIESYQKIKKTVVDLKKELEKYTCLLYTSDAADD